MDQKSEVLKIIPPSVEVSKNDPPVIKPPQTKNSTREKLSPINSASVTVAIVTFNETVSLIDLLRSLNQLSSPELVKEVIFIDNSPLSNTLKLIENHLTAFPYRYINNEINNLGLARKKAVETSTTQYIAFTDADCIVPQNWVKNFHSKFLSLKKNNPKLAGLCSSNRLQENTHWKIWANYSLSSFWAHGNSPQGLASTIDTLVDHLPTTNAFFDKDSILESGNFSEAFSAVGEDLHLGWKLKAMDFVLYSIPNNTVINNSEGSVSRWFLRKYKFGQNRVRILFSENKFYDLVSLGSMAVICLYALALTTVSALPLALYFYFLFIISLNKNWKRVLQKVFIISGIHFFYGLGCWQSFIKIIYKKMLLQKLFANITSFLQSSPSHFIRKTRRSLNRFRQSLRNRNHI